MAEDQPTDDQYVIEPLPRPWLPVRGGGRFPVRRIYCVGRNYADHAREMGSDPDREPPFFFSKPADAVVRPGEPVPYPPATEDLQHEVELVVAMRSGGSNIAVESALEHVHGYAVGVDLTRRDLQAQAKKTGRPWDMAKGFDHSAPMSEIIPAQQYGVPDEGRIALWVNDELRQDGDLSQMIWSVAEVIAHLSTLVELRAGDLIMTGTPSGVGRLQPGAVLRVQMAELQHTLELETD